MRAVEQPASAGASWPLRITVAGLPPSPNRRMAWQARRHVVKPMADAVAWQARAFALPRPLERAHVVATLVHRLRQGKSGPTQPGARAVPGAPAAGGRAHLCQRPRPPSLRHIGEMIAQHGGRLRLPERPAAPPGGAEENGQVDHYPAPAEPRAAAATTTATSPS